MQYPSGKLHLQRDLELLLVCLGGVVLVEPIPVDHDGIVLQEPVGHPEDDPIARLSVALVPLEAVETPEQARIDPWRPELTEGGLTQEFPPVAAAELATFLIAIPNSIGTGHHEILVLDG